jgi:glutamyl/glutaminyl-tRNA synthetase
MTESAPTYVGRLAPSPTGLLHLGHARTFWIAFQRAQQAGGTLWLRDEDLDPHRSRPEFSAAMREDLHWLGITWNAEFRQSDRLPLYRDAMQQLLAAGPAYPCTCSRKDLQSSIRAPHDDTDDEPIYTGHCRTNNDRTFDPNSSYRFRVPDGELIAFTDLNAGPQAFRAGCNPTADFGDFLIWRKDGLPSYQLACVVDDAAMGITEVVRGRDLLKSTARQILLQRALNLPTPHYFHTDLMRDESGVRLAKRHDALSLKALRESGLTPDQIRARFFQ